MIAGQKVKFNGKTSVLNDQKYAGCVGTVDFECAPTASGAQMVYINIRAAGQRKERSIAVCKDTLEFLA